MRKKYTYENGVVWIDIPNEKQIENIKKSTKHFAEKVIYFNEQRGNIDDGDNDMPKHFYKK